MRWLDTFHTLNISYLKMLPFLFSNIFVDSLLALLAPLTLFSRSHQHFEIDFDQKCILDRKDRVWSNFISSPEPLAIGELLRSLNVRRPSFVVRRVSFVVNNCFKGHLLLNYWLDFDQTWLKWSLYDHL